jgi:citrate lyase subunit beta/citryl-CoA lyase
MYGASIRELIRQVLCFYEMQHAHVSVEDTGALPWVIAARCEAALRRMKVGGERDFLLPAPTQPVVPLPKERFRRSRLYLPGNEPKFFINAVLHKPDCIILDLEDSVSPSEKDSARVLVRNALRHVNFGDVERMVRINRLPEGLEDLRQTIPYNVQTILIPKCESGEDVVEVAHNIEQLSALHNLETRVLLLPIIESALGVVRAFEIASASNRVCALAIGLEDYTADIGVARTRTGTESLYARSAVVNAAKAAGLQALDSVFSDVSDDEGLRQSVQEARAIGFDGKGCIHPRQIRIVHEAFAPTADEIAYAARVVDAYESSQRSGSGVVALGSKMIDAPVVRRAQRVLALADRK